MIRDDGSLSPEAIDILTKLLQYDPEKRIGCRDLGSVEIKQHPFFKGIDFDALERKELEPPFVPEVAGADDYTNFDPAFTNMKVVQTPVDRSSRIYKVM